MLTSSPTALHSWECVALVFSLALWSMLTNVLQSHKWQCRCSGNCLRTYSSHGGDLSCHLVCPGQLAQPLLTYYIFLSRAKIMDGPYLEKQDLLFKERQINTTKNHQQTVMLSFQTPRKAQMHGRNARMPPSGTGLSGVLALSGKPALPEVAEAVVQ